MIKLANKDEKSSKITGGVLGALAGIGVSSAAAYPLLKADAEYIFQPKTKIKAETIERLKNHMLKNPSELRTVRDANGMSMKSFFLDKKFATKENIEKYLNLDPAEDINKYINKNIIHHGDDISTFTHELGHASFYENKSKAFKTIMGLLRVLNGGASKATIIPAGVGYGLAGSTLADDNVSDKTKALVAGGVTAAAGPALIDEGIASIKAMNALKTVENINRVETLKKLGPAFLTYAGLPLGAIATGYAYNKLTS